MTVKKAAAQQYRAIANRAAAAAIAKDWSLPSEGWIATVRKALNMSGAQLARRLNVTRSRISQAEQAELSGGMTLRSMQSAAEAMGCRFVYAIVPAEGRVQDVVAKQARKKARTLVRTASTHMGLERQSLPDEKNRAEVERITSELLRTMPADLWNDP